MVTVEEIEWVLWCGTVGFDSSIADRLLAATAGAYRYVSLSALDVKREEAQGRPPSELRRMASDHGCQFIVDPIMNWHPMSKPSRMPFAAQSVAEVLAMSEALGAVSVSAIAATTSASSDSEMVDNFAALCDAAESVGARVHLEFMPMSAVPDLSCAWNIVSGANHTNGGLMFDTWHFFRSGPDFDLLAEIPGDSIFAVQVDDAKAEVTGTLWEDTANRLLPGEGIFDLTQVITILAATGGLTMVGPEVISPFMAALTPIEAASLAGNSVRELIAKATTET